ncbi:TSUP family transporter [Sorangium sp. So ce367]|uniref:TSUP family transporter n=1 Tax=Sorangium sp. So ce367 TaxID=3133305 RepID=UPI003F5EAE62
MQQRHAFILWVCCMSAVMLACDPTARGDPFLVGVFAIAILANGAAGITGFGVATILLPVITMRIGIAGALAAVAVPHAIASATRLWRLRFDVEPVLALPLCAAGGAGALVGIAVHALVGRATAAVLGVAFVLATAPWFFAPRPARVGSRGAWLAGAGCGLMAAIAGPHGALQFAALEMVDAPRWAYVATASAVALTVDIIRLPATILWSDTSLSVHLSLILVITSGVLVGDALSERLADRIPRRPLAKVEATFAVGCSALVLLDMTR